MPLDKSDVELSDREIDARVALRMDFKWIIVQAGWTGNMPIRGLFHVTDDRSDASWTREWDGVENIPIASDWDREVPRYSTKPEMAMLVQEAIEKIGYSMHLRSPWRPGDPWIAGFTPRGMTGFNGEPDRKGLSSTMPRAICLGALETWQFVDSSHDISG